MKTLQQLTDKIIDEWMCLPKRTTTAEQAWLRNKIREAYIAGAEAGYLQGFKASGEGWNGEFPCRDKGWTDEQIWEKIKDNTFLASLEKPEDNS